MIFFGVPATTVIPADVQAPSAIAAPASTTTPASMHRPVPWPEEDTLLAFSSTTSHGVELTVEPLLTSSTGNGVSRLQSQDDGFEVEPVATIASPRAVIRMRGRVLRVTRPRYQAVGLLDDEDAFDDE